VKSFRILIVALAVAAIAAPTAAAMPIRGPLESQGTQDMRASVAEALAKERKASQQQSQPVNPPATVAGDNGGIDWATIAIGVGLTFVALGAVTGVTHWIRVKQRPRVA
jgi:hypothetical protein